MGVVGGIFGAGFVFIVGLLIFIILPSLRICSEWERKVVLRLGRFAGVRGPGIFFLLPFIERTPFTIDLRTVTSSFTAEQTLTRDNVPVNVDTIVYWRVVDPAAAVLAGRATTARPCSARRRPPCATSSAAATSARCSPSARPRRGS